MRVQLSASCAVFFRYLILGFHLCMKSFKTRWSVLIIRRRAKFNRIIENLFLRNNWTLQEALRFNSTSCSFFSTSRRNETNNQIHIIGKVVNKRKAKKIRYFREIFSANTISKETKSVNIFKPATKLLALNLLFTLAWFPFVHWILHFLLQVFPSKEINFNFVFFLRHSKTFGDLKRKTLNSPFLKVRKVQNHFL